MSTRVAWRRPDSPKIKVFWLPIHISIQHSRQGPKIVIKIFFDQKFLWTPNFFLTQNFSSTKIFFRTKNFIQTQNLYGPKIFIQTQNLYGPKKNFGPKIFSQSVSLTQYVVLSVCPPVRLFQLASELSRDVIARRRSDYCPHGAIFFYKGPIPWGHVDLCKRSKTKLRPPLQNARTTVS